jgi:hypothetical protein
MEDASESVLRRLLPDEWIVRPIAKDYGVDFEIELVDQEIVSGNRVWVQLKSVEKAKRATARFPVADRFPDLPSDGKGNVCAEYVPYPMAMKAIDYARRCHFPLLLVLVDFAVDDAFWLPIRDEANMHLGDGDRTTAGKQSATLKIPVWNSLAEEKKRDFSGLRWYALEPARMYAFAVLHYFYHEFEYEGRLSGYSIGDGHIDFGEEEEMKRSLMLARENCLSALKLDVLFGEHGVDYFKLERIPVIEAPGIMRQITNGTIAAEKALKAIETNSYTFQELALLLGTVNQAMNLMSTAISSYQGFRARYLLTEETTVWRAWSAKEGGTAVPPIIPTSRKPHWPNGGH